MFRRSTTQLRPVPVCFDGRWLWRGGSTRSHPELGSENPLRGWYCRGHPVGEYGAAGHFYNTLARCPIARSAAGVGVFLRLALALEPRAGTDA